LHGSTTSKIILDLLHSHGVDILVPGCGTSCATGTKVFAIAGLDGRTIGSKSLISFSSGWTLIIKQQMLSSTIKQKSTSVSA